MKKSFLIALFGVLFQIADAQVQDTVMQQTTPTTSNVQSANPPVAVTQTSKVLSYSGGYGHFFTGIAWIEPTDLVNHLRKPEVLGSGFNWTNAGVSGGAEGFAEIHNLLIGGGGYGIYIDNMEGESSVTRFSFGGGFVKVGYVPVQNPRYFMSVNAGFGGGVMYLGIENESDDTPIYFSSNEPIQPNQAEDYFRGYMQYDLSITNKFIASRVDPNRRKFGGVMFGLDLGATLGLPVDTWRDGDGPVTGIPSPGTVISPYLRLTIGGGGFRKFYAYQ